MLFLTFITILGSAFASQQLFQTRRYAPVSFPSVADLLEFRSLPANETFVTLRYQLPHTCLYPGPGHNPEPVLEVTAYDYAVTPEITFVSSNQVAIVRRGEKVASVVVAKYYCPQQWHVSHDNGFPNELTPSAPLETSERLEYYGYYDN